ncbi:hypothetical protein [Paraburkholderia sp. BCC1885]|uniref:hypothetical protein n=1 Tax=Paraburkholderia sp. BCC1885 TaxID=2562669 RepID=UPI001182DE3F|nr:hypothetical protein [Paraburkholderia sp. BCC1885]
MDMPVRRPHPMPEIAGFVASLREAFGDQVIDEAIRKGKAGEPTFFASENGRTVGTRAPLSVNIWRADRSLFDRHFCPGCDGSCIGTGASCRRA